MHSWPFFILNSSPLLGLFNYFRVFQIILISLNYLGATPRGIIYEKYFDFEASLGVFKFKPNSLEIALKMVSIHY